MQETIHSLLTTELPRTEETIAADLKQVTIAGAPWLWSEVPEPSSSEQGQS